MYAPQATTQEEKQKQQKTLNDVCGESHLENPNPADAVEEG